MKREVIIFDLIVSLLLIFVPFRLAFAAKPDGESRLSASKSEVRVVGGIPRLFINNQELRTGAVNIYYLPDNGINVKGMNDVPAYDSENWLINTKAVIDQAVKNNARLLLLNVWWKDLDKSKSRPRNIADNLDFRQLDRVFEYARQKQCYIIPLFVFFPFAPDWWLKENNFPPYHKGKICDFCETDSYGNVYNNPSMNSDIVQRDWGVFIEAMVKRYKSHPALAGWIAGVGATGEDGYGPNYIFLMGYGNATEKLERKEMMFTDYSPYFRRKFREWLKDKYRNNKELRKSWDDQAVTLESLGVPAPKDMLRPGAKARSFPDPTDLFALAFGENGEKELTVKGRDFYEFRNYMRRKDRIFYINLIKNIDPEHVFILSASHDDALPEGTLADGVSFSLMGTIDNEGDCLFYYIALDIVEMAKKHKKLALITSEHMIDTPSLMKTGRFETFGQLRSMELLGESVKCRGGIFAYTAAPYNKESLTNRSWIPPLWFSEEALDVAKKINDYIPDENCACLLFGEVYSKNGCASFDQAKNCRLLNKIYRSYCDKP